MASTPSLSKEYKKCSFSKNGCDFSFATEKDRRAHELRCIYQEDECPQCDKQVLRKEMGKHVEENCDYRTDNCRMCQTQMLTKDIKNHSDLCAQNKIKCQGCGNQFSVQGFTKHFKACTRRNASLDVDSNQFLGCLEMSNNGSEPLSREMAKHFSTLGQSIKRLQEEHCEIKESLLKIKQHMGYLANDVEILKFLIAEKDGAMARVYQDMELAQATMEKEKDTFTECLNEQNNFNMDIKEKVEQFEKKINSVYSGMSCTMGRATGESRLENLNLNVGCAILSDGRPLSEIKRQISNQLYNTPDCDMVVTIYPGISVEKRIRWKDCGPFAITRSEYCYKLTQDKYGTYLILSFSIYQQCADKWVPPDITHCMCVVMDPEELKVIYYSVEEQKLGFERATGMNYLTFGPYKITRELFQQLKAKSHCAKLHSAFILYNIEGNNN